MKSIDFSRNLIKGKIAEIVFEQMFREMGEFTILHLGYEYTTPELAQYQKYVQVKKVLDKIRHAPDFVLISQDKTKVFVVEVKYRMGKNNLEILDVAEKTLKLVNPAWLFVASSDGFYFDSCSNVIKNNGIVKKMSSTWVSDFIQAENLKLLNEFEK